MDASQVAMTPMCVECDDVWIAGDDRRWLAYLDGEDHLVFYCPSCAEVEFDERD